ncbi:TetR/AcrR family transcriptional regulator [Dictyobacter arantiisoli]|uniref:TetR family transcriptional regulator n=1 Tax=Dictyobacter arantiisoli TaxID=2014874 RepID=A0A5A5TJ12_9CHLR|nr:TetR/AcrR family transcriptional regulator [Dictyobacter arantiisoli]GCF11601.1 TetR family transcriptional regulator [Dictyobacter arantiisoli]
MTQNSANLRVRRMQKLLREALLDLIEERGFDALTVSEIIERAMVSRTAFYRHYQDKYDLVEQIFEEAMSALLNAVGELGQEHPAEIWVTFFEHIAVYARLYRALLGSKGSPWFVRRMRAALSGLIKERGRHPHGPDTSSYLSHGFSNEFVPDLVSAMFVETITWWLEHERPYTPREIATKVALLASALFKEASTW